MTERGRILQAKKAGGRLVLSCSSSMILYVITLFLIFPWESISTIDGGMRYIRYIKVLVLFIAGLIYLSDIIRSGEKRGGRGLNASVFSLETALFSLYAICILALNLWDNMLTRGVAISQAVSLMLLILVVGRALIDDHRNALRAMMLFWWVSFLLNFITVMAFPEGLYTDGLRLAQPGYLLGIDNQFGKSIFPGMAIIWFAEETEERRSSFFAASAFLMNFAVYFLLRNGTGMVVMCGTLMLYIAYRLKAFDRFLSMGFFAGSAAFIEGFLLLRSASMYSENRLLTEFTKIIGKDMTFSGRTKIWIEAMRKFARQPLLGYGVSADNKMIFLPNGYSYSAHNFVLQTLLEKGIAGSLFMLIMFCVAASAGAQVSGRHREVRILFIGFISAMIYFMMEVGNSLHLFQLFLIMVGYQRFVNVPAGRRRINID